MALIVADSHTLWHSTPPCTWRVSGWEDADVSLLVEGALEVATEPVQHTVAVHLEVQLLNSVIEFGPYQL